MGKPSKWKEFEDPKYVSRGGFKLEKAVREFGVEIKDKIVMDVGASTGGFTDFLIQNKAKKVYAVDVGYGILAWKLRNDDRVVVLERRNIRYLEAEEVDDALDLATFDVSFISLEKIIGKVVTFLKPEGEFVALIKPQFEAKKEDVEKGGVVKDKRVHKEVIKKVVLFCKEQNLGILGLTESPLEGPAGNREFFVYVSRDKSKEELADVNKKIEGIVEG